MFVSIIYVEIDIFSNSAQIKSVRNLECPPLFFWQNIEVFYGVALAGKAVVVLFENVNSMPHLFGCKICVLCQREVVGRGGMAQAVFIQLPLPRLS